MPDSSVDGLVRSGVVELALHPAGREIKISAPRKDIPERKCQWKLSSAVRERIGGQVPEGWGRDGENITSEQG